MKATSFVAATLVALSIIGCAENSNPVQADNAAAAAALARSADDGGNADRAADRDGRLEGTITAVDVPSGIVVIAGKTVKTNSSTKIERNGLHATLSQFKIGDRGQARFTPGVSIAVKVEATSN